MKRIIVATLTLVVLAFSAFGVVSAHAKLDHCTPAVGSTVPAAPAQIICIFSEEIDTKQSTMSVFNASNVQVDKKDAHVDLNDPDHKTLIVSLDTADTPNGLNTVKWHAVTPDDGGISDGSWQFVIGNASATPYPPTEVAAGETPGAGTAAAPTATTVSTPTPAGNGATTAPTTAATAIATAAATATAAPPTTAPTTGGTLASSALLALGLLAAFILLTAGLLIQHETRA